LKKTSAKKSGKNKNLYKKKSKKLFASKKSISKELKTPIVKNNKFICLTFDLYKIKYNSYEIRKKIRINHLLL
jgi:hypothetical protein